MAGVESHEVKLNYYAFVIAIFEECSIETAFEKLQSKHPGNVRTEFTEEDIEDMRKLRAEGISWAELGRIFGVPRTTVQSRLRPKKARACS